jgi:hypothetical protein
MTADDILRRRQSLVGGRWKNWKEGPKIAWERSVIEKWRMCGGLFESQLSSHWWEDIQLPSVNGSLSILVFHDTYLLCPVSSQYKR